MTVEQARQLLANSEPLPRILSAEELAAGSRCGSGIEDVLCLNVGPSLAVLEHPNRERAVVATSSKEGALAKSQQELRDGTSRRLRREAGVLPDQKPRRSIERCCELQGLPGADFTAEMPFTMADQGPTGGRAAGQRGEGRMSRQRGALLLSEQEIARLAEALVEAAKAQWLAKNPRLVEGKWPHDMNTLFFKGGYESWPESMVTMAARVARKDEALRAAREALARTPTFTPYDGAAPQMLEPFASALAAIDAALEAEGQRLPLAAFKLAGD